MSSPVNARPPVPTRPKAAVRPRASPVVSHGKHHSENKIDTAHTNHNNDPTYGDNVVLKIDPDFKDKNGNYDSEEPFQHAKLRNLPPKPPPKETKPKVKLKEDGDEEKEENFTTDRDQSTCVKSNLYLDIDEIIVGINEAEIQNTDSTVDRMQNTVDDNKHDTEMKIPKVHYDPASPPPKPPRGIPNYKCQLTHSYTYNGEKGGSLGRYNYAQIKSQWKTEAEEDNEDSTIDNRPRALSDFDCRCEHEKDNHARLPPKPPPKALKPKLSPDVPERFPLASPSKEDLFNTSTDHMRKGNSTSDVLLSDAVVNTNQQESTSALCVIEEAKEVDELNQSTVNNLSMPVYPLNGFKPPVKDKVIFRNKPQLRNRKEVRQSVPVMPDENAQAFKSHLKDVWKSQSVKRFPSSENKQLDKVVDKDNLKEKRELMSKLAAQRKKNEAPRSTLEENQEAVQKLSGNNEDNDTQMFEFVLVVSLRMGKNNDVEPYISFQFPPKLHEATEKDAQIASIPDFCFPDLENEHFCDSSDLGTYKGFQSSETFSFVLTDVTGKRNFGYCRHILVKDKSSRGTVKSEVYCIISPYGLFSLYSQVLDEVERQRAYSASAVFAFLKAVLSRPMPPPGNQIEVPFFSQSSDNATDVVTLVRPRDSAIHEHVDFSVLFDTLSLKMVLTIVSCLLLEKRVILAACQLGLLSSCCHGLIALLYPFSWLHTYIPVLPSKLVDMCCLPTPYLLGILSGCIPSLDELPLDEVVIVDLDARKFIRLDEAGDSNLFPKDIKENIEKTLQPILKDLGKKVATEKQDEGVAKRNAFITEVFVQAYIHMIGHFPDFLNKETESDALIQRQNFYRAASTKEQKKFLKKFVNTQAFENLVVQKINEEDSMAGLFEKRLGEWRKSRRLDFGHLTSKLRDFFPKLKI